MDRNENSMNGNHKSLIEANKARKLSQDGISAENIKSKGWLKSMLSYPSSPLLLEESEAKVFSHVKTSSARLHFVNVGSVLGEEDIRIRTFSMNEKSEKTPLILIHGFGASMGFWVMNLDELGSQRPVHAIDLPGFGRSSRPNFSSGALEVEREMVYILEAWRKEMKLERVILLGHSFGGFLSTTYAFQYPDRVSNLILVDPWGFPEKPAGPNQMFIPCYLPPVVRFLLSLTVIINPLWFIRAFGRIGLGPKVIDITTPMLKYFSHIADDGVTQMSEYIFHCNSQTPTGEVAFRSVMTAYNWSFAKFPLCHRISSSLNENVPITVIYGSLSWLPHIPGSEIQKLRPQSYVDIQIIEGVGHDVYAEETQTFNTLVQNACAYSDKNDLQRFSSSKGKD